MLTFPALSGGGNVSRVVVAVVVVKDVREDPRAVAGRMYRVRVISKTIGTVLVGADYLENIALQRHNTRLRRSGCTVGDTQPHWVCRAASVQGIAVRPDDITSPPNGGMRTVCR